MTLSSHSAPGTSAAFSYQFERALYWLARSPAGFLVGIETHDDVAIQGLDASLQLEQDKHSVSDGKPFGDRSKGLWNTLATWIDALHKQEVPDGTHFLMVTNKTLPECIARQISNAKTDADIDACLTKLRDAAAKPSEAIAPLVDRVLDPSRLPSARRVILNCELADATENSAGSALRSETIAHLQLPQWCLAGVDSIVDELLGWLHATALFLWQEKGPAWISRDHFVNQLHAVLSKRLRQISRERAEHLIPVPDELVGQNKASMFVRQLYLVTDDDDVVDAGIREFLRCNIEKSRLSVDGNITDDDWKAFEVALLSRWQKIRARVLRMRKDASERDAGFEIFTDTTEEHREMLAGSGTEQVYLTSGSYHRMANLLRVGWHPLFNALLKD